MTSASLPTNLKICKNRREALQKYVYFLEKQINSNFFTIIFRFVCFCMRKRIFMTHNILCDE